MLSKNGHTTCVPDLLYAGRYGAKPPLRIVALNGGISWSQIVSECVACKFARCRAGRYEQSQRGIGCQVLCKRRTRARRALSRHSRFGEPGALLLQA